MRIVWIVWNPHAISGKAARAGNASPPDRVRPCVTWTFSLSGKSWGRSGFRSALPGLRLLVRSRPATLGVVTQLVTRSQAGCAPPCLRQSRGAPLVRHARQRAAGSSAACRAAACRRQRGILPGGNSDVIDRTEVRACGIF